MGALMVSMMGIVAAILLQLRTTNAYLYIINASLVGGMIAWLISLLAHVRFRRTVSDAQLADIGLRSPLGSVGSILGFIAHCGCDRLHLVGIAIKHCRQERRDLSGGAERGVFDGEEERDYCGLAFSGISSAARDPYR